MNLAASFNVAARTILSSRLVTCVLLLLAGKFQSVQAQDEKSVLRSLQAMTPKYSVTYAGYFQILADSSCSSPSPVLVGYCRGDIEFISASHLSVTCNPSASLSDENWNALECTNSCAFEDDCASDVYLTGFTNLGLFGEIIYKCSGEEVFHVDTAFGFSDNGDGLCTMTDGYISHNSKLGVSCNGQIVIEDYFTDCDGGFPFPFDGPTNELTCFNGDTCSDSAPCPISFGTTYVNADYTHFYECIESSLPVTSAPTPADIPTPQTFAFSARFEASWGILFRGGGDATICPQTKSPTIRITCGGEVEEYNSVFSIDCMKIGANVLECTDTSDGNFVDQFVKVQYDCNGFEFADTKTMVEFLPQDTSCSGNTIEATVSHALQMGVLCGRVEGETQYYDYRDKYFDCGEQDDKFDTLDEFGDPGPRYSCIDSASVPAGSNAIQTVPLVSMETDLGWNGASKSCYSFDVLELPTAAPVSKVDPIPGSTPVPTSSPTEKATDESKTPPLPAPTASTTAPPALLQTPSVSGEKPLPQPPTDNVISSNSSRSGGSSAPIGAIVGGAVGGVAIVAIAGLIALRMLRRRPNRPKNKNGFVYEHTFGPSQVPRNNEGSSPEPSQVTPTSHTSNQSPSPPGNSGYTATYVSSSPPSPSSTRGASRSGYTPDYKDQTRSVLAPVPLVEEVAVHSGERTHSASQLTNSLDSYEEAVVSEVPTADVVVSNEDLVSATLSAQRRAAIDP